MIFDKLSNDVSKLIKSDHNILDIDHLDLNQILKMTQVIMKIIKM